MTSVEKEGMKLYDKLGSIGGEESASLQEKMEDFGTHGTYRSVQSLNTLTLGHELKVLIKTKHIY
jgi:hypothetical protein